MAEHTDDELFIAAPFDLVWETVNDVEAWPELFAGEYAKAEILERTADWIRFRLTTEPHGGTAHQWVSDRYLDRENGTVTARRLEPGPFRYMHIFQSVTPAEGGVRLRWVHDFEARPGAPFTDEQMRERIGANAKVNMRRHKEIIERRLGSGVIPSGTASRQDRDRPAPGHVDIRMTVKAPVEPVWAAANDPVQWAAAGHGVHDVYEIREGIRFRVTAPAGADGSTISFLVERYPDQERKTVFSRRLQSDRFRYSHVWFAYTPTSEGTEMRCVVDFEGTSGSTAADQQLASLMERQMRRNMAAIAARITGQPA